MVSKWCLVGNGKWECSRIIKYVSFISFFRLLSSFIFLLKYKEKNNFVKVDCFLKCLYALYFAS